LHICFGLYPVWKDGRRFETFFAIAKETAFCYRPRKKTGMKIVETKTDSTLPKKIRKEDKQLFTSSGIPLGTTWTAPPMTVFSAL
jgi:hypothetical protein